MLRSPPVTTLAASVFLLAACADSPASFDRIELSQARELVRSGAVLVIDAVAAEDARQPAPPNGMLWELSGEATPELPELPEGAVLIVAASESTGFRGAAALARVRNAPIYLVITGSAEERGRLYALEPSEEEIPRGRDS